MSGKEIKLTRFVIIRFVIIKQCVSNRTKIYFRREPVIAEKYWKFIFSQNNSACTHFKKAIDSL